jgi:hypothetical protein
LRSIPSQGRKKNWTLTNKNKFLALDLSNKINKASSQFSHKQLVLVAAPVSTGAYSFI